MLSISKMNNRINIYNLILSLRTLTINITYRMRVLSTSRPVGSDRPFFRNLENYTVNYTVNYKANYTENYLVSYTESYTRRLKMKNVLDICRKYLPGILLCFGIAAAAWFLGSRFSIIGGAVFGIVLGMTAALIRRPASFEPGIRFTSKKILQYSIILLGFEMNMWNVIKVGTQSLFVMLFTLSASFITAFVIGKVLKIPGNMAVLIGVGTSICGGSAIAATAPVIKAKDEDVAQAISTIFLFNIIAVFLFPALGALLGLSDIGFGMWAGTAVNDTSSVVAAASAWSERAGNGTALQFATIVKLTRTLMIVPVTLVLAVYTSRKAKKEMMTGSAEEICGGSSAIVNTGSSAINGTENPEVNSKSSSINGSYSFRKVFPWFVLGFLAAALIYTFLPIPASLSAALVKTGKFLIVMAMAAIGLNTNLKKLLTQSMKPILLGLCCWSAVAVVSLLVQTLTGRM